jgi:hypothetical protein
LASIQLVPRNDGRASPGACEPAVAVYPDSDKVVVWTGNDDDHVILHRRDGDVGYYDGEA